MEQFHWWGCAAAQGGRTEDFNFTISYSTVRITTTPPPTLQQSWNSITTFRRTLHTSNYCFHNFPNFRIFLQILSTFKSEWKCRVQVPLDYWLYNCHSCTKNRPARSGRLPSDSQSRRQNIKLLFVRNWKHEKLKYSHVSQSVVVKFRGKVTFFTVSSKCIIHCSCQTDLVNFLTTPSSRV